jgi:type III pantothenate kinase
VLLAIDVGNSNLKCGLFRERVPLHRLRRETPLHAAPAALAGLLLGWLEEQGVDARAIDAVIVASVVPALNAALSDAVRAALGFDAEFVGPDSPTGIQLRGPSPLELGADRLVNAVAGWALAREWATQRGEGPAGSLVVDLGTATKIDCVSPQGELLGGIIAPGVVVSLEALVARTARLRAVQLSVPPSVLGRSTLECVQSGLLHGHASLIDGLVAKLRQELPFGCDVVATGGLAALIAPLATSLSRIEPDLTLEGLRLIHAARAA